MREKSNINITKILLDMTGIVFAVLLALWLENWMQNSELQKQSEDMSVRIEEEIKENRQELVLSLENNEAVLALISDIINDDEIDINLLAGLKFEAAGISDSSWVSAQMLDSIYLMDVDKISTLADIYETQKYYTSYNQALMKQIAEIIVGIQLDTDKRSFQVYATHIGISNSIGSQLLATYDNYLSGDVGS